MPADPKAEALTESFARPRLQIGKPDTGGERPTGKKLTGPSDLRQVPPRRKGKFIRNLTGRMLSYALGRALQDDHPWTIREVAAAAEKDQHRLSALVLGIARSTPFRYRRSAGS